MGLCLSLRPFGNIGFLVIIFSGDPEIFDSGVQAYAIPVDIGLDVVQFEVVTDISIEFTVIVIAGIAVSRAPHLARGVRISSKRRKTRRSIDRCIHTITRPAVRPGNAMCFQDREEDSLFSQEGIDSGVISALGKPKTPRFSAENALVVFHTNADLSSYGRFVDREHGKIAVRGSGRHEIHLAEFREAAEAVQEILRIAIHKCFAHA